MLLLPCFPYSTKGKDVFYSLKPGKDVFYSLKPQTLSRTFSIVNTKNTQLKSLRFGRGFFRNVVIFNGVFF
jgi:hypothetical protein